MLKFVKRCKKNTVISSTVKKNGAQWLFFFINTYINFLDFFHREAINLFCYFISFLLLILKSYYIGLRPQKSLLFLVSGFLQNWRDDAVFFFFFNDLFLQYFFSLGNVDGFIQNWWVFLSFLQCIHVASLTYWFIYAFINTNYHKI